MHEASVLNCQFIPTLSIRTRGHSGHVKVERKKRKKSEPVRDRAVRTQYAAASSNMLLYVSRLQYSIKVEEVVEYV